MSLLRVPTTAQSYAHTLAMASTIFSTVHLISHIMRKIKLLARWRLVWWVFYLRATPKWWRRHSALQLNQFAVICRFSWFDLDKCAILRWSTSDIIGVMCTGQIIGPPPLLTENAALNLKILFCMCPYERKSCCLTSCFQDYGDRGRDSDDSKTIGYIEMWVNPVQTPCHITFVWMKTIDKLGDDFELQVQKFVVEGGQLI